MFLPIDQHATSISEILMKREDGYKWHPVLDWLMVTSSVVSVEVDTIRNNYNYGWCSGANEFDDARDSLIQQFVQDYSVFSFAWGALEAALNIIKPPIHPDKFKRGKIRDACYLLDSHFSSRVALTGLIKEVEAFRESAQACLGKDSVDLRFKEVDKFGSAGIGLYAVYELRNQFAHGSLEFPMPDEENRPISEHESMVKHATRIVLIELQMLLIAYFYQANETAPLTIYIASLDEEVPLDLALTHCHLQESEI